MKKYKFDNKKFIKWVNTEPEIKAGMTYHETYENMKTLKRY